MKISTYVILRAQTYTYKYVYIKCEYIEVDTYVLYMCEGYDSMLPSAAFSSGTLRSIKQRSQSTLK